MLINKLYCLKCNDNQKIISNFNGNLKPINYVTYISWSIWSSQRLQKTGK